jgi:mRNA interferase MazF
VALVVNRFDVYLVSIDPTVGAEIQKTRLCLIISPDEMNAYIQIAIIAPMATKARNYPTRVSCRFEGKDAHIVLDQICTVDKVRLIKRLGRVSATTHKRVLRILAELFAE